MSLRLFSKSNDKFLLEIESFCVLTGPNGAGKTRFLTELSRNSSMGIEHEGNEISREGIRFHSATGSVDLTETQTPPATAPHQVLECLSILDSAKPCGATNRKVILAEHPEKAAAVNQFLEYADGLGRPLAEIGPIDCFKFASRDLLTPSREIQILRAFCNHVSTKASYRIYNTLVESQDLPYSAIDESLFHDIYGSPPWDKANDLLQRFGLEVRFCKPNLGQEYTQPFTRSGAERFDFRSLSPGEQGHCSAFVPNTFFVK